MLSIIIVSYNTKELTLSTIESILKTKKDLTCEIIVVDNNSRDGSVDAIRSTYGETVTVLAQTENRGFASANNIGLLASHGTYILLLNSDTQVLEDSLQFLVESAQKNPRLGILSCKLLNSDGSYQPQGGALPTLLNLTTWALWPFPGNIPGITPYQDTNDIQTSQDVVPQGWVGGTAMLFPKSLYQQIGKLDENIFMYAEDIDYCIRARSAGWQIGIVPNARIIHLGSASGSRSRAKKGEIAGLLYLAKKHKNILAVHYLGLIFALGAALRYLLFGILRGNKQERALYAQIFLIALRKGKTA